MGTAVLLLGHGSRQREANAEFERFVASFAERRPELDVAHSYVELASPSLADGLAQLAARAERVVVLPVFLFAAGHVKNDVPLALAAARRRFPGVAFASARALGVDPGLASAVAERIESAHPLAPDAAARTTVILVGRGSSDPDANGDFCKVARLLAEGRPWARVEPCFAGIARPFFAEAAERAAQARPERVIVAPYLLFAGRLIDKLGADVERFRQRYPWIDTVVAPHLGDHQRVLALLDERVDEALHGARPLPCDGCQYRVPLPARAREVGGVRALLWSLRHEFTHSQAAPHLHAHRALAKHVLVCTNVDCAERGSVPLVEALRDELKDRGLDRTVRVTRTSCMGRCGEGPTVAVYPDGVWYRGVVAADAAELVSEHLSHDRLVARLLDGVMQ